MTEFYRSKKKSKKKTHVLHKAPSSSSSSSSSSSGVMWEHRLTLKYLEEHPSPRDYTLSVAVPGSLLSRRATSELSAALVGQLARTLALFEVDEVVVFMDTPAEQAGDLEKSPSVQMSRLLQFLEAPPYLRKKLFPVHRDLKLAGLLPSLDTPHHMKHKEERSLYREGVVTDRPAGEGKCWVDVGMSEEVRIDHPLRPGVRVTVRISEELGARKGTAVSPNEPREKYGLYWGYQTRLAHSFSEVFSGCPFQSSTSGGRQGYDFLIGHTTNRGKTAKFTNEGTSLQQLDMPTYSFPSDCKRFLMVFGGAQGLEGCVEADESLATAASNTDTLFDVYWNALPTDGCRYVRTEEELMVSLSKIKSILRRNAIDSSSSGVSHDTNRSSKRSRET